MLTLMYVQYYKKTLVVESKTKKNHFQFNHFETKIFLVLNLPVCRFFTTKSMKKGCKNHRETLYPSKGKIVYVVGKSSNIYKLRGKPYDTLCCKCSCSFAIL